MPIITLKKDPLSSLAKRTAKRIFDLIFSAFVTVFVLFPIFIVVGFLIKIGSPGPIIFTQERAGRKNKRFRCYKFRTMYTPKNNSEATFKQATKADPRVTKIGAFLRKTSLDELPQFFNVLLGNMSVVGPRPHPIPLDGMFAPKIHKYQYRYFIKPGITGPAQINGFRGETKTPYEMEKRVEYDTWYIENWSLFLDIKLIFATVFNVFKGEENAY
ncbi:UNVERIFIED_CONTAM: hypothetical protein GTU68_025353 [Idotea baltica]|nr:hypothetical protein [Idotea baltica]